jgi:hypothetical protein
MRPKRPNCPAPATKGAQSAHSRPTEPVHPARHRTRVKRMKGQSPEPRCHKTIEAETGGGATLRANGTGSRATPWFEGAQPLRRCAPLSESAHLGKPRRFLRRCAPFSKVRTKKWAHSRRTKSRPGQSPGLAGKTMAAAGGSATYAPTAPGPGRCPGIGERTE